MNIRFFSFLSLALASIAAVAQEHTEEWIPDERPECFFDMQTPSANGSRKIGSQATAPLKARGVQYVPVVLVAFADMPFTAADKVVTNKDTGEKTITPATEEELREYYRKYCNGTMDGKLYKGHQSYGSIRDYFVQQSDSVFLPEFDIIGPVTLDNGYAYYGANSGSSKDVKFSEFRSEALNKAMTLQSDWSKFDNDGNSTIDMVFFLFAGLGESNTRNTMPDLIWPKESTASTTINGTVFATSAVTCELRVKTWNAERTQILEVMPDGVGVFIHELSHALGLPDFYDTQGTSFGMDVWSVMDYGEYGGNGYKPGNYTAYERDFMGWRGLKQLDEPCYLTIPCFADGGTGYKISSAYPDEYYIIENRQARGWDEAVGNLGHGLQVTHVDFLATKWSGNKVNVEANHQRMTIVPANNSNVGVGNAQSSKQYYESLAGNLYPGTSFNYNLTDESVPASTLFNGGYMSQPLRNIQENEDGTVTVCFRTNGKLAVPELADAENVEKSEFDVSWGAVENATQYEYELKLGDEVVDSDSIMQTSQHFENLQEKEKYTLRVRALADAREDYIESEWSQPMEISTLSDGISRVPASSNGVEVYTMSGVRILKGTSDALTRSHLRTGIYIVRYASGTVKRIFIP